MAGEAGRRAVVAAVDEEERHVERPLGVRAEHVHVLERERQDAAAVRVGVEPDARAVALVAGQLAVDHRRVGAMPMAQRNCDPASSGSEKSRLTCTVAVRFIIS